MSPVLPSVLMAVLLAALPAAASAASAAAPARPPGPPPLASGLPDPDTEDMRLLRMPDIHGDLIVFCHGGNLWTVAASGGQARRLTNHEGWEAYPKFSPDGRWIAFTGDYDGNPDVYVVPTAGGEPRRLTFHPAWDRVIDWQPDGKAVRFQSPRASRTGRDLQLWTVPLEGGQPANLGLPTGGLSSYAPDGQRLAYNRATREERTWKRYKGGWAQDVWIFDFAARRSIRLTDWVGTDNFPMWHGDSIYFTSDRTGRLEIWVHELGSGRQRQITRHDEYDVKWPSLGSRAIVYENGGWLHVLDLASEQVRRLQVSLRDDRILARPVFKDVGDRIESFGLAPDAKRAVFCARGDIFTVPAEKGDVRNLTATPGVREMAPAWSPDGRWVAYLSDRSGEYEICLRAGDGRGEEKQLTTGGRAFRFFLSWSPDSKRLAFADSEFDLWVADAATGRLTAIDRSPMREITEVAWSPDGRWLAYAKIEENLMRSIFVHDLREGRTARVTDATTDDGNPAFDPEGRYLYFTSARHFQPAFGGYDMRPFWTRQDGLYLATLKADAADPFAPESDEVAVKEAAAAKGKEKAGARDKDKGKDKQKDKNGDEAAAPRPVDIDLDGIGLRIVALPVGNGNYGDLRAAAGKLFYLDRPALPPPPDEGGQQGGAALKVFLLEDREEKTVLAAVDGYDLSADGKKILVPQKGKYGIVDAAADQKPAEKPLRTGELKAKVDPRAEWAQIFRDVWRLERDFFYDPGMHGVDWDLMGRRYGQLVPYVAHRYDLGYLIGELIGELNCSHTYAGGGDAPRPARVGVGMLGCDFTLDAAAGRYRLANILTRRDWNGDQRTPLFGPGIDVREGDYLLAVDGVQLHAPANPYALFEAKAGRQVTLTVGSRPDGAGSRDVVVQPIESEAGLRYVAWVEGNRRRAAELSGGRIGYLHLPNTAVAGVQEFAKGYYPQLRKEGLIIDERFNGGGFIPDLFMNILQQRVVNLWGRRPGMQDWVTPHSAFVGHLAMLSNGYAGSGGDALPYYFKFYELGPVIGTRTWGGLVGIDRGIPTIDGGRITMPSFGLFNLDGEWDVEGHGTEPDIAVDNLPEEEMAGRDPQLEKAVEVLLQRIASEPPRLPARPDYPRDKLR